MSATVGQKRRNPRFTVNVPARLRIGSNALLARLRNVCRDAALVEAPKWFPLETEIAVAMELPGTGGPLEVSGRVVRLAPGEQGSHGMAILFTEVPSAAADRIDFFVAVQETPA